VDEEVAVSDGIGSFKESSGDGFEEDGGGQGFKTVDDDDFKEDVLVLVAVAADPEYVEEEEGFGFNVTCNHVQKYTRFVVSELIR
jgi:hypothetical protein